LVGNVPLRIYKPVTVINETSNPAVIFYHGGAFIFDKIGKQIYALLELTYKYFIQQALRFKDQYNHYLYLLAKKTNFTVISVM
jgi:hypothetical protein